MSTYRPVVVRLWRVLSGECHGAIPHEIEDGIEMLPRTRDHVVPVGVLLVYVLGIVEETTANHTASH